MIELVKKEELKGIWAGNMKNGDIGVIVSCAVESYLGRIVQMDGSKLTTIGMFGSWIHVYNLPNNFRIRLLEKGEMLVVA